MTEQFIPCPIIVQGHEIEADEAWVLYFFEPDGEVQIERIELDGTDLSPVVDAETYDAMIEYIAERDADEAADFFNDFYNDYN